MGIGSQLRGALNSLFPKGPRSQRSRLCVQCNRIVGVGDGECSFCGTKQTAARKAMRAATDLVPNAPTATWLLLLGYGILHILPALALDNTGTFDGLRYILSGDETRQLVANAHVLMGANNNVLLEHGQYWRLLTATFLHIGGMHIVFNGYALWILGRPTEKLYGWGWFLSMYVVAGVVANGISWQLGGFPGIQAGASGSIFGLIGIGIVHCWRHRWANRDMLRMLLIWAALGMVFGATMGADNWAHGGGLVTGAALAWLMPAERVTHRKYRLAATVAGILTLVSVLVCFVFAIDQASEFLELLRQ